MLLRIHKLYQVKGWRVGQVSSEMLCDLSCISVEMGKGIVIAAFQIYKIIYKYLISKFYVNN